MLKILNKSTCVKKLIVSIEFVAFEYLDFEIVSNFELRASNL